MDRSGRMEVSLTNWKTQFDLTDLKINSFGIILQFLSEPN